MCLSASRDNRRHNGGQRGRDRHQDWSKVEHNPTTDPRERGVQPQPAVEERAFSDNLTSFLFAVVTGEREQRDLPDLGCVAMCVGKRKQATHGMADQVRRPHVQ